MIRIDESDMEVVLNNLRQPVSALIGDTATGKSTTLLEEIYQRSKNDCVIFCVQRTKVSVDYLYNYMNGILPNNVLGYVNENEYNFVNRKLKRLLKKVYEFTDDKSVLKRAGILEEYYANGGEIPDTQIVYVTAGYFKKVMYDIITYINICKDNNEIIEPVDFCKILVLDECNKGPLEYDMIMSSWVNIIQENISVPRLLLISATLDIESTIFPKAPCHELKNKNKKYLIKELFHNQNYEPNSVELLNAIIEEVYKAHLKNRVQNFDNEIGETYIIFVSGTRSVKYLERKMKKDDGFRNVKIVSIYAGKNFSELKEEVPPKKRRIVITTNVLETSITIPNVTGVFDGMDEKVSITSRNDRSELVTIDISKSSAKQRAGRTGRTCDGFVYRMITQEKYYSLRESSVNEIISVPIHKTILEIIKIKREPLKFLSRLISKYQILRGKITDSMKLLDDLGFTKNGNYTYEAEFYFKLNLSLRMSKFLSEWFSMHSNLVGLGIMFASILENYDKSYFVYKGPKETLSYKQYLEYMDDYYTENFSRFQSRTNLGATLSMWREFFDVQNDPLNVEQENLEGFAEYSSVNYYMIKNVLRDINYMNKIFLAEGYEVQFGLFDVDSAVELIVPILGKVYSDFIFIKESEKSNGEITYKLNTFLSEPYYILPTEKITTKNAEYPNIIIGLRTTTIKDPKTNSKKNIIEIDCPYTYKKLKITNNTQNNTQINNQTSSRYSNKTSNTIKDEFDENLDEFDEDF